MWSAFGLLILSNIFMTVAWYGHLKHLGTKPFYIAILVSWGIAFFEYCFQVPANRIGAQHLSLPQLKVAQEIITMVVFSGYAFAYAGAALTKNYFYASICLVAAAYFMFRDGIPS